MVSTVDKNNSSSFEPVAAYDISQQMFIKKRLDTNKATQKSYILTKLENVLIIA